MAHERAENAPRTGSVFSEPDFVRLWIIGVSTFTVRWLETLVISVFVYQRTSSEFTVALMMMWRVLPMALFGAFLGAWSDVIDRRLALMVILIGSLATSLSIAALAFWGMLEIWQLGIASFVNGIAWACDNPVRRTLLGQAAGPSRLGTAMAVDVGSNNASRVLGPAIGGILMVAAGIHGAFFCGALLYFVGLLAALALEPRTKDQNTIGTPVLTQLLNGWREISLNDRFRGLLLITILFNIFGWPMVSLIPVISQDVLRLKPDWTGVLTGIDGAATLLGAILIGSFAPRRWFGRLYVLGAGIFALMMGAFATAGDPVAAVAILLAVGLGGAGFSVMQSTLVFMAVPPALRGAAFGILSVCIGVSPLGLVLVGSLANVVGAPAALKIFSVLGVFSIAATFTAWRKLWTSRWAPG